jgi:hypothetical protein
LFSSRPLNWQKSVLLASIRDGVQMSEDAPTVPLSVNSIICLTARSSVPLLAGCSVAACKALLQHSDGVPRTVLCGGSPGGADIDADICWDAAFSAAL